MKIPQESLKKQDFDYDAIELDADVASKSETFSNIVKSVVSRYD